MMYAVSVLSLNVMLPWNNAPVADLMTIWFLIFISVVTLCFIVSELTSNYSQVDKLWSILPVVYSWTTVALYSGPRTILMAVLVTLWGLRLSYNFGRKGGYNIIPWKGEEDYRWSILRKNPLLKGRIRFGLFNLLFISVYQNFVIVLFSSPLLLAAQHNDHPLNIVDIVAGSLMLLFLITETIADNQLFFYQSRKKKASQGEIAYTETLKKGFVTEGLWKYSRHPNFASEQAIWLSFYLFGATASGHWLNITLAGPVLLILIFTGSTILTEKISSGKYPEYAAYRQKTPKFIPRIASRRP